MSFWRAPSYDELAIIAVAIIAFIVWKTVIDDSGGDAMPAPTPTPVATATAAATATPTPAATAAPSPTATPTPAPAVSTDQCDFGTVAADVRAAIVEVVAEDLGQGGTAFHIGSGVYVTAAHVIQNEFGQTASSIALYADGARLPVTVDKVGSYSEISTVERDLAILNAPAIAAELKYRSPSKDDEVASIDVRAFGYPWSGIQDDSSPGGSLQTSRGIVSAVTTAEGSGIKIVQTDAGIDRGMSGGPLVDECGYALAVASFFATRVTDGEEDPSEFPVFISIAELDNLE